MRLSLSKLFRNEGVNAVTGVNAAVAGNISGSGEEIAAIAVAVEMFLGEEYHDREDTVLTINRIAQSYSPWSSKIYGLNQTPDRR